MPSAITAIFKANPPHRTYWLELELPADQPAAGLVADFARAEWEAPTYVKPLPPDNGRQTLTLVRPGSDLLAGWTPSERKQFLLDARMVLTYHGIEASTHNLTPQEALS